MPLPEKDPVQSNVSKPIKSREYAWILSRLKLMSPYQLFETIHEALNLIQKQGQK